jgi:putative ABC transport system permease protein
LVTRPVDNDDPAPGVFRTMDLRFAWRTLCRTPAFSLLIITTLALGIGATTTMFSAIWAVFLRPLPYPEQHRLVTIWQSDPATPDVRQRLIPANFVDWAAQATSFDALGALPNWEGPAWTFNVVGRDGMERVRGIYASSGFFAVMRIAPRLGRTFTREEDRTRGVRTVIISDAYWQRRFDRDPSVVGRTLEIDTFRGGSFTIVGVMPPGFDLPRGADIWLSLADWGGGAMPERDSANRCCAWYATFGRLRSGVTDAQAQAELTGIADRVWRSRADGTSKPVVHVAPLRDTLVENYALTLFALFGAVGCVLLIGSANVANLLLSRAVGRRREVLTRLALGATRWRLARQLLTESLVLAAVGAGVGFLLTLWGQNLLAATMADRVPFIDESRLDGTVLLFATGVTGVVTIVCSLVPLIDWSGIDWNARVQTESRISRGTRQVLVVGQVALAVAVVASAGLLVRTVARLRAVDVGFDTTRTLVVRTDLTTSSLRERGRGAQFVEEAIARIRALPHVRAAGASTGVPLEGGAAAQTITRQGDPPRPAGESPLVVQTAVTPAYFAAMGIPLLRGRTLTEDDRADGVLVAVINETAARRYWPGEDPIGRRFAIGSLERFGSFRPVKPGEIEWREIVGVVADVRLAGFALDQQPHVFYTYKQFPLFDPAIIVRTTGDPRAVTPSILSTIRSTNARAIVTDVRTLEEVADRTIADFRLRASLASIFSAAAVLLGMLGIYGLLSYMVAQRTREIGIRMALGAERIQVARLVMGQAARLAGLGLAGGLLIAHAVARGISSLFFGVGPTDAVTMSVTCLLMMAATVVAVLHPLRHAVNVEPSVALRDE